MATTSPRSVYNIFIYPNRNVPEPSSPKHEHLSPLTLNLSLPPASPAARTSGAISTSKPWRRGHPDRWSASPRRRSLRLSFWTRSTYGKRAPSLQRRAASASVPASAAYVPVRSPETLLRPMRPAPSPSRERLRDGRRKTDAAVDTWRSSERIHRPGETPLPSRRPTTHILPSIKRKRDLFER